MMETDNAEKLNDPNGHSETRMGSDHGSCKSLDSR